MTGKRTMQATHIERARGGLTIHDVIVHLEPDLEDKVYVTKGVVIYGVQLIYRNCQAPALGDVVVVTVSDPA